MGWFWADANFKRNSAANFASMETSSSPSKCPVMPTKNESSTSGCPVMPSKSETSTSGCPVIADDAPAHGINPLNNMPYSLDEVKQPGQKLDLSTSGTVSSIPKGTTDSQGNPEYWEFPSPQKMYNAMLRKGKIDPNTGEQIPEDAVESMVFVHNYLNEGCWEEILEWEKPYIEAANQAPKLWKFMGKPHQLTPRARCYHWLGMLFPSKFSSELPFDRHDWIVLRPDPNSVSGDHPGYRSVRYVIDFYGGPDDEHGLPTFHLDVRPGLDNLTNAKDRFRKWTQPVLDKYFPNDNRKI
ncbi:HDL203Wp [Eremothecium sinecaudum]|uniref:Holocytochrome c-type synthase n=1 Tax=Eremothecium sinecaudum TaxID=45286 RepID=A0A0X8HSA9_9SACH|nr:HDL203Wp [Eremothecium sinecaudum]AMD20541.1 HDL203Wp [Eremothecium sinecaudum]